MDFKIDWIAWTVPIPSPTDQGGDETQAFMIDRVLAFLGAVWEPIIPRHGWQVYKGRGFYQWVLHHEDTKASIQWGNVNSHIHVELSGKVCRLIDDMASCEDILQIVGSRLSRLDLACDIETDTEPLSFTDNNEGKSVKAGGHFFSEDGKTVYVGSRESERYARVYRYHPPHPRSKYLRVECVLRGDYAKAGAKRILEDGLVNASLAANKPYGWKHPCWRPSSATVRKISAPRSSQSEAKTIRWLLNVVAPSLARACSSGAIELDDFIDNHVKPKM